VGIAFGGGGGSLGPTSQAGGELKFWANTYLAGAFWGTSLIVTAVVAFVLLVSLQALHEWPISGLAIGVGSEANGAPRGSTVIGEDNPGGPNLKVGPKARPSGAANSASDAPRGTAGKRRHSGEGDRAGSLADRAPVASATSVGGPVARNPGSHPSAGAGTTLAAPQAGPSGTGGRSSPASRTGSSERGAADKAPDRPPTTTEAVPRKSSGPKTKGQSGQRHGTNRMPGPPASTGAAPRNPNPGPPGASAISGRPG